MPNAEGSQEGDAVARKDLPDKDRERGNVPDIHLPRTRKRASLSCRECRRRKQKCNQAKDRPCNNCARRYPPVECVYDAVDVANGNEQRSNSREPRVRAIPVHGGRTSLHPRDDPAVAVPGTPQRASLSIPLTLRREGFTIASRIRPPSTPFSRAPIDAPQLSTSPAAIDEHDELADEYSSIQIRELSLEARERLQKHTGSSIDISAIFLVDRPRQENPYFNRFDPSRYMIDLVPAPIGASAEDTLTHLPLDATRRNAELLHFFVQRLSPFTTSIDGHDPSPVFNLQWITFMIQSPLVVYLSILSAAYFQATAKRIDVEKSVDAMTIRTKLIGLINEHISGAGGGGVSDEAIAAVMSLSYNELIYSDKKSVFAHLSGLRSMIRTRGGLESIRTPVLRLLMARTDYQISLTFECDPFIHVPRFLPIQPLSKYPFHLDSPFLLSPHRFTSSTALLNLSLETAQLLDDMRFLTTSIHALLHSQQNPHQLEVETTKFLQTASWLHSRLTTSPISVPETPLHQTLHTAALILLTAVTSGERLSQACSPEHIQKLWGSMWRVPLPRWKQIPGIFLWVLLIVNPAVRERPEGRFVKGMIAAGFVGVGIESGDVLLGIARACGSVQLWLETAVRNKLDPTDDDVVVKKEAGIGGSPKVTSKAEIEEVFREPERVLNQ